MIPDLSELGYREFRHFTGFAIIFCAAALWAVSAFFRSMILPKTGQENEEWFGLGYAAAVTFPTHFMGLHLGGFSGWTWEIAIGCHAVCGILSIAVLHARFFVSWGRSAFAYGFLLVAGLFVWPIIAHFAISLTATALP